MIRLSHDEIHSQNSEILRFDSKAKYSFANWVKTINSALKIYFS